MSQTAKKRPSRSVKAQGHWYWCHSTSAFLLVFCCNYVSTLHYLKILKDTVNYFHKFKEVTWPPSYSSISAHQIWTASLQPFRRYHCGTKFEISISTHYKGMKGDARVPIIMRSRYGDYILPCGFFFSLSFFHSPNLSGHRVDTWCGLSANLECRSEMCCTQNWCKKSPSRQHQTTLWAESSQRRHVSTIGKKHVKQQYVLHMFHNMANFGPLAAEIGLGVWGTPANFNSFRVLAALLHATLVVDGSQTLRHWTEGAMYGSRIGWTLARRIYTYIHRLYLISYL